MTPADYAIDWALILVVLIQLRKRRLTVTSLIRPFVIAGIAVLIYLRGIPTAGNDLRLLALAAAAGLLIGAVSGQTVLMRTIPGGGVLARSGWASAIFWILGMGSRFAFLIWISHGGAAPVARFSAEHAITSKQAWDRRAAGHGRVRSQRARARPGTPPPPPAPRRTTGPGRSRLTRTAIRHPPPCGCLATTPDQPSATKDSIFFSLR
jgi:hypothetical protein